MPLRLVDTADEGRCSVCGEPCRVRCAQHDGSRFHQPLGELWRLVLLTCSAMAWIGFALTIGWLIGTGTASGLHLIACLAGAFFLLNFAYHVWRHATGRAASDPPPQKVIHVRRPF